MSAGQDHSRDGRSVHSKERVNPFVNRQPLKPGRAAFLERVRKGLGHPLDQSPKPPVAPPERDEKLVRQFGEADAGRVDRWVQKARGNTMVVERVAADAGAVHAAIEKCFAAHKIGKSIVNAGEIGERFGVKPWLAAKGIGAVPWGGANCRDETFNCDASITDCRAGLADAGSILVWSDAGFGRSSTLVVPVHVVLMPASRIMADMIDGLAFAHAEAMAKGDGRLPSNIVVINGPSKTADIEMNLVTGVHGPKYLYVVVIDGA